MCILHVDVLKRELFKIKLYENKKNKKNVKLLNFANQMLACVECKFNSSHIYTINDHFM